MIDPRKMKPTFFRMTLKLFFFAFTLLWFSVVERMEQRRLKEQKKKSEHEIFLRVIRGGKEVESFLKKGCWESEDDQGWWAIQWMMAGDHEWMEKTDWIPCCYSWDEDRSWLANWSGGWWTTLMDNAITSGKWRNRSMKAGKWFSNFKVKPVFYSGIGLTNGIG